MKYDPGSPVWVTGLWIWRLLRRQNTAMRQKCYNVCWHGQNNLVLKICVCATFLPYSTMESYDLGLAPQTKYWILSKRVRVRKLEILDVTKQSTMNVLLHIFDSIVLSRLASFKLMKRLRFFPQGYCQCERGWRTEVLHTVLFWKPFEANLWSWPKAKIALTWQTNTFSPTVVSGSPTLHVFQL